ncbi:MAG: hypothetical protein ACLQJR_25520 [Stellaceae bacterium]
MSTDKQARLEASPLAAKEAGAAGDGGASAPTASLFALPRGGARQRLLAAARSHPASAPDEAAADGQAAEAIDEHHETRDPLLYSKGDASASGFRPWYWSYERDGGPPPSDSAGTVTRFPASAPSPVSPPDPASALATLPPETPRRTARLTLALLAAVGALALVGVFFFVTRAPPPPVAPSLALAAPVAPAASVPAPEPPENAVLPPPSPEPVPAVSPQEVALLLARGDKLLATGDIAAARLFYERAAEGGSAAAATAAGKTYDPLFLAEALVRGIRGDPVAAARWYRKASAAGDKAADGLMQRLMARYAG